MDRIKRLVDFQTARAMALDILKTGPCPRYNYEPYDYGRPLPEPKTRVEGGEGG